ncbi:MAG: hypothetical protein Q4D56_13390 [Bacteroides sp.]|nr:hypothetical protein [Bacteroides sp.]
MITTKITIESHLAEYLIGKYGTPGEQAVRLPSNLDLYVTLYDLLQKRPADCPVDRGNLELVLPERREAHLPGGKPTQIYNYIGERGARILSSKVNTMMRAEMHELFDENKHVYGIDYINSAYYFLRKYSIESLSVDALLKDYQRWRRKLRRKTSTRDYHRKQQ